VSGGGFLVIVLLLALFWLLLIRPQRRRQAIQNQIISSVEIGDEIVTAGGLYGHVRELGDEELLVEIAPGTNVRIARRAIAAVLEPDEDEEDEELEEADEEPAEEAEEPAAGGGEGPAALEKPR
jgi:preprotein translocase subunit YajC